MRTARFVALCVVALAVGASAHEIPVLLNAHAAVAAVMALWIAATSVDLTRVLGACGYLAVCEVFWRLPGSLVPWFGGSYLVLVVIAVVWFRLIRGSVDRLAVGYILCLLPGIGVAFATLSLGDARSAVAFNLLGGVVLAVTTAFTSRLIAEPNELGVLCWWIVAGALHLAGASLASLSGTARWSFTEEANLAASGGFGPNQVSLSLSAGILAALFITMRATSRGRVVAALSSIILTVIAVLTLSRTGPFQAALAFLAVLVARSRAPAEALWLVARGVVIVGLLVVVVGPRLDDLTGGATSERFGTAQPSHRDELAAGDLVLFSRNPLFGVGVAQSPDERARLGYLGSAAHTEPTRLLAEQGISGVVALILMVWIGVRSFRRQATRTGRGWTAGWIAWSVGGMMVSANRVGLITFAFGLAALTLRDQGTPDIAAAAGTDPDGALMDGSLRGF